MDPCRSRPSALVLDVAVGGKEPGASRPGPCRVSIGLTGGRTPEGQIVRSPYTLALERALEICRVSGSTTGANLLAPTVGEPRPLVGQSPTFLPDVLTIPLTES